jgi:hypothetical protein
LPAQLIDRCFQCFSFGLKSGCDLENSFTRGNDPGEMGGDSWMLFLSGFLNDDFRIRDDLMKWRANSAAECGNRFFGKCRRNRTLGCHL